MSEPAAWYVRDRAAGPPMLFWDEERAKKAAFSCGCGARPLYLHSQPTLTDAEREAIDAALGWCDDRDAKTITTLRGLLERLK